MPRRSRPTATATAATATAVTATAAALTSTTTTSAAVSKSARVAASQQAVLSTIAGAGREQMEFQVKDFL